MNWTYINGNWVLCPPRPIALIHFLGGAFVASAPQISYNPFLSRLAIQGYGILAPPIFVQPDHQAIALDIASSFQKTYQTLGRTVDLDTLPVYGIGHSLGAKLQLLLTCDQLVPRNGNILVSFNNFDSDRAIPFAELTSPIFSIKFSPTPTETLALVKRQYQLEQTLVLRFQTDSLDESQSLIPLFSERFPAAFIQQTLAGDHLTPLELDIQNAVNRSMLERVTLKWLNYQQSIHWKR